MQYVKNFSVPRSALLKPINWNDQKGLTKGIIHIDGEYTFDYHFEIDRQRWFSRFNDESSRVAAQDRYYLARQLVIKQDIAKIKSTEKPLFGDFIPAQYTESPKAFLYNELLSTGQIIKRNILPELRKRGAFSPITPFFEEKFFSFDMQSFDIKIFEVPHNFTMRKIFKITFRMNFNLYDYLHYLFITKRAKFKLDLWPELKLSMIYTYGFPYIFMNDKMNFFRAIEDTIIKLFMRDQRLIHYIYSQTKLRIDKVNGFSIYIDPMKSEIVIRPKDTYTFSAQVILGKLDVFNRRAPHPGLEIQNIDTQFVKSHAGDRTEATLHLLYLLLMTYLFTTKRVFSKSDVEKLLRDLRSGKVSIEEL